jgi:hypothetical protein
MIDCCPQYRKPPQGGLFVFGRGGGGVNLCGKKMRFYVIENDVWQRRCKMNNMKTLLQFAALKEVTDIGNINALVKTCA